MSTLSTTTVRSMTGQGHATEQGDLGILSVEVRTVNNRGFKCAPRVSDSLASLESRIEALARSSIRRGSVHLSVIWRRPPAESVPNIDTGVLQAYYQQIEQARQAAGSEAPIEMTALMTLPGVIVSQKEDRRDDARLWNFVESGVQAAIENLNEMRAIEGAHMAASLHEDCEQIRGHVDRIAQLAPQAATNYQQRLESKIKRTLAEHDLSVESVDLLREVQIYADRADISEEITRLGSHLKMFVDVLDSTVNESGQREPTGRKLDFIIQEMFRETNTIGSKAADAEVSAGVVEIKCAIERMRELVQNLE
ncbi:MAG: YicC family protein [Pirellulaceae bacterium]|nr:YicC family protein [Pirellulaceae bacterium]